jgi:hypothetical protein
MENVGESDGEEWKKRGELSGVEGLNDISFLVEESHRENPMPNAHLVPKLVSL